MTPVERLQAAIHKLETLIRQTGYYEAHGWLVENITTGPEYDPREEQQPLLRDELLVTLHRTIDAQLAILRNTVRLHSKFVALGKESVWLEAIERAGDLALADAILGGDS